MEPKALVEALESLDRRQGSTLLRAHAGSVGLSQSFFERLAGHFASDQALVIRLGAHCPSILRYGDRQDLGYRGQAIVEMVRGRWRQSARAFVLAGESATDPIEKLSFKVGSLHALGRAGRIEEALALGKGLSNDLRAAGREDLAARADLNLGNVLIERDRYGEAIGFFEPSIPALEKGGFAIEALSARLGLSTANLYGGSLEVAQGEAQKVANQARRLDQAHLEKLAQLNLAHVALLRGQHDEALGRFIELSRRLSDVPSESTRCFEFLGDTYARLNLWDEALDAYRQALESPAIGMNNRANVSLGIGQVYAGMGERSRALESLKRAYELYRRVGNEAWASAALTIRAQITGSKRVARRAAAMARRAESPYHLALALIALGEREEADSIVRTFGYAGLEWRLHHLEGRSAEGSERLRAYRCMFESIQRGRAAVSSVSSRTSYLRDKTEALRDYLHELLARPNARRIDEAVRVVVQSRSVALLDEVFAEGALRLNEDEAERLTLLREELRQLGDSEPPAGSARRLVGPTRDIAAVQRRWQEATRFLLDVRDGVPVRARGDTLMYIEAKDRLYAILGSRFVPLDITAGEAAERLKWLHFDLSAPLVDPSAGASPALESLRSLGEQILGPVRADLGGVEGVCPDGCLWRLPWDACLTALGIERGVEVRLHPGFQGTAGRPLPPEPRVGIWVSKPEDLPHAEKEADALLRLFPRAEVFARSDEVRGGCRGRYDLVHVIGHARQREANPMFSYFAFPDGPLYAAEVARLGFTVETAVLSACDTGSVSLVSLDEPDGLARAFLARGASGVVASSWPLDDEAAHLFTNELYVSLLTGVGVRGAVDGARSALRRWKEHPYYWGCPALYGGYRL
ncbi:MAG TPA: CHAT domain-containing tetratricopeptide repeat protein [Fimbriimonas sp.]